MKDRSFSPPVPYQLNVDRVLRLTSEGINGLRNDMIREAPFENYETQLREFTQTAKDLGRLQQLGLVEISFESEEIGVSGPLSAEKVNLGNILRANTDNYKLEYPTCFELRCKKRSPITRV